MKIICLRPSILALAAACATGCASYRVASNVPSDAAAPVDANRKVFVTESTTLDRKHNVIGPIEVSVKKLTIFHQDPTKEQANEALIEKGRAVGADAIINVTYKAGIGFTSWGYMDAKGTAVKFAK